MSGGWVEPDGFLLVSVPLEPRRRQVVSHCTQGDRSSVAQREAWQARGSSVAQREARQARGHPGRIIRAPPSPGRVRARGDRAVTAVRLRWAYVAC